MSNSPFIIVRDFLSPLVCDTILNMCNNKKQLVFTDEALTNVVNTKIVAMSADIHEKYGVDMKEITLPDIITLKENTTDTPKSENSKFTKGKWLQVYPFDLTGTIFLNDTNYTPPFDFEYEVFGGKLEFPQHEFGFNSNRGVMVLHPSGPHFINRFTTPEIGDLHFIKFHIIGHERLIYQPKNFPGDYTNWFINDV